MDFAKILNLQNEPAAYSQQLNDFIYENRKQIDSGNMAKIKVENMKRQISCMQKELDTVTCTNPYTGQAVKTKDKNKTGIICICILAAVLIFAGMFQFTAFVFAYLPPIVIILCGILCGIAELGTAFLYMHRKKTISQKQTDGKAKEHGHETAYSVQTEK